MFPNMVTPDIMEQIENYKPLVKGWKLSGAGGGGYLVFVADKPLEHAIQLKIRRKDGN
jgi:galactokinase/mevalonate kinase-like predicted kinase